MVVRKFCSEIMKVSNHCLEKKSSKTGSTSGFFTKGSAENKKRKIEIIGKNGERKRLTEPLCPIWISCELWSEKFKEFKDFVPSIVLHGVHKVVPGRFQQEKEKEKEKEEKKEKEKKKKEKRR